MRLAVGEQGEGRTVEQDRDHGEVAPRRSPPWQMGLRDHARDEQRDRAERNPGERQLDGGEIAQAEFDPPERASPRRGEQYEGDLPRQPVPSRGALAVDRDRRRLPAHGSTPFGARRQLKHTCATVFVRCHCGALHSALVRVSTSTITINAPRGVVWAAVSVPENVRRWQYGQ